MQYGVLITDNGAHSAEKWADATSQQICPINQKMDGDRLMQARRTQMKVMEALLPHHSAHQEGERLLLSQNGDDHLDTAHDPVPRAEQALTDVVEAMKGSPWEDKTADPEWRQAAGQVIATHFATSADIERRYHCHRNPSARASAFLANGTGA